ncbi:phosphoserine phosphatase RsbU [Abditibacteriota bacterium]|nr:phosphoserine phosphatase RsbU [Abditibacteriota bacterium]
MSATTVAFALSVFNLLLCSSGLIFVFFEWNAARRREYLYLYFGDERPGQEYFVAARRHRVQYTRLLWAFSVLGVRHFLAMFLAINVANSGQNDVWNTWQNWLLGVKTTLPEATSPLFPWLGFLEALSLALFVYALLLEWRPRGRDLGMIPVFVLAATAGVWALIALLFEIGTFGRSGSMVVLGATSVSRFLLGGLLFFALRSRAEGKAKGRTPMGVFVLPLWTASLAFGAWVLFPTIGDLVGNPIAHPIGHFIAFSVLMMAFARSTLNDYESIEMSRHRLGRERAVLFTFLKRLGSAFTTDVEVDQILRIILESALETSEASAGAIYLFDAKSKRLDPRVVLNFFPPLYIECETGISARRTEELEAQMRHQDFSLGEGVIGEVAKTGQGRLITDVRAERIMLGTTTEFMRNRSMLVVPLRVRDELLGVLAVLNKQSGSFGTDDLSLLQALADQASLSVNNAMLTVEVAEQERIRRDLQIARDIQQQLLPDACPNIPGFEIAARGTSATEVGGDYYDFFWVDDDHLGILVADVSGKGVPAALVVAMIRSAFRAHAPGNTDVREVLAKVNSFITGDLRSNMFVTCVYGILEVSSKRFSWGRAGHEPLLVAHPAKNIDILKPDGFALGIIGAPEFSDLLEIETIELHSGDRLLLFTDGLTEAMNSKGEEFGMTRILETLNLDDDIDLAGFGEDGQPFADGVNCDPRAYSEPDSMRHLEDAVSLHVGDAPQSDDLTIVYLAAK